MRVLYVCADPGIPLDGTKGASIHVQQTLRALAEQGIDASIAAARPGAGIPGVRVFSPEPGTRAVEPLGREVAGLGTSRDLVQAVPLRRGEVDVVYERHSLWSLAGVALAESLRVPLLLEVNAPLVAEQKRYRGLVLEGVAREIEKVALTRAEAVLCVSSALVEWVAGVRGSRDRVELFPNFVDVELFRPRQARRDANRPFTAVFVGSLKPWHGMEVLIDALARLRDGGTGLALVVVGDGPERANLERQAAGRGLAESISFTGAIPHEKVPEVLQAADVAVAPYPQLDEFYYSPLKVVEYLAAGLPVVASAAGDLTRWLRHDVSALLVPPGDEAALAGALLRLARSPEDRDRIGREGRALAESRFSRAAAGLELRGLLERAGA